LKIEIDKKEKLVSLYDKALKIKYKVEKAFFKKDEDW